MAKLRVKDPDNLKYLIAMCGYSITSLAIKVGRAPTYMNHIVNGKSNPSPATAKRIVDAINQPLKRSYHIHDIFFDITVKKNATKSV